MRSTSNSNSGFGFASRSGPSVSSTPPSLSHSHNPAFDDFDYVVSDDFDSDLSFIAEAMTMDGYTEAVNQYGLDTNRTQFYSQADAAAYIQAVQDYEQSHSSGDDSRAADDSDSDITDSSGTMWLL